MKNNNKINMLKEIFGGVLLAMAQAFKTTPFGIYGHDCLVSDGRVFFILRKGKE